jgi:predicted PurR-regulated permease PerM
VGMRSQVTLLMRDIDVVLSGFIRGQIIVAAFVAVAVTIALLAFGIRYAILIGVFAGLADMIPYVGAVAGAIPAVLVAFLTYGPIKALFVGLAFLLIYELEGHFVAPGVVGKRVGLSALLVIVAILMGAEFGGIVGMFVAVPVAAIIRVLWRRIIYPLEVAQVSTPVPAVEPTAKTIVIVNE